MSEEKVAQGPVDASEIDVSVKIDDMFSLLNKIIENNRHTGTEGRIARLKTYLKSLLEYDDFKVGDIVVWRNGLRNRNYPDYGVPAIVVEVLSTPLTDESVDAGSQYFREPLNIRLGIINEDGNFITYVYDSRRFELYKSTEERISELMEKESF